MRLLDCEQFMQTQHVRIPKLADLIDERKSCSAVFHYVLLFFLLGFEAVTYYIE